MGDSYDRATEHFNGLLKYGPETNYVEHVPIEALWPYREFERGIGEQHQQPLEYHQALTDHLKQHGQLSPVTMQWHPETGLGYLGEGNTRLAIGRELGHKTVPVRIMRSEAPNGHPLAKPLTEPGAYTNEHGYAPQYINPSQTMLPVVNERTSNIDDPMGLTNIVKGIDLNKPAGENWEMVDNSLHINGNPPCPECGQPARDGTSSYGGSQLQCGRCNAIYDRHPIEQFKQDLNKWHTAASEDELHVALSLPDHIADKIEAWAKEQDWPKDTELEDKSEYHITLLYSPEGHDEHRDADWFKHTEGYDVEITTVDEFGEEEPKAIVLRLDSPEVEAHADDLQDLADNRELPISRFPGGYKPHITVAYAPNKPEYIRAPKLKFKTGPSSVSPPRESKTAMAWPDSLYHVSPSTNRDSIAQQGLMGHDRSIGMYNPTGWGQGIRGNYAYDNQEDARTYALSHAGMHKQPMDIWRVNGAHNLQVDQDPEPWAIGGEQYFPEELSPDEFEDPGEMGDSDYPQGEWMWWQPKERFEDESEWEQSETSAGSAPIRWRIPHHVPAEQLQHVEQVHPEQYNELPEDSYGIKMHPAVDNWAPEPATHVDFTGDPAAYQEYYKRFQKPRPTSKTADYPTNMGDWMAVPSQPSDEPEPCPQCGKPLYPVAGGGKYCPACGHQKTAGATRTQRLHDAHQLEAQGVRDSSEPVHTWDDGWSIKRLTNYMDEHREGTLMSHCLEDDDPDSARTNGSLPPAHPYRYSLRDPDNLPHVTFDHFPPGAPVDEYGATFDYVPRYDHGVLREVYGQHNSYPKQQYAKRLFDYVNQQPFPTHEDEKDDYGEYGNEFRPYALGRPQNESLFDTKPVFASQVQAAKLTPEVDRSNARTLYTQEKQPSKLTQGDIWETVHVGAAGMFCPKCNSNDTEMYDGNPENPSFVCNHCDDVFSPSEATINTTPTPWQGTCPRCKSTNFSQSLGTCYDCRYSIPGDGSEIQDEYLVDENPGHWKGEPWTIQPNMLPPNMTPKQGAMTLPQEQRQWQELSTRYPSTSEVEYEFPHGWTVQNHASHNDVNRVGTFMHNCWQETQPEWFEGATQETGHSYKSLHDEHGLPRVAFFVQNNPHNNDPPSIKQPLAMRNNNIRAKHTMMLEDYADANGIDWFGHTYGKTAASDQDWLIVGWNEPINTARTASIEYDPNQRLHKGTVGPDGLHIWPVSTVSGSPQHSDMGYYGKDFVIENGNVLYETRDDTDDPVLAGDLTEAERLAIVQATGARFPRQAKTAAQNVMYHVAPQTERQQIIANGIDGSQSTRNMWDDYLEDTQLPERGSEDWPEGNYLFARPEDAQAYIEQWPEPMDIYTVNTDGLSIQPDPQLQNSYYSVEPITPDRISLLSDTREANRRHTAARTMYHMTAPANVQSILSTGINAPAYFYETPADAEMDWHEPGHTMLTVDVSGLPLEQDPEDAYGFDEDGTSLSGRWVTQQHVGPERVSTGQRTAHAPGWCPGCEQHTSERWYSPPLSEMMPKRSASQPTLKDYLASLGQVEQHGPNDYDITTPTAHVFIDCVEDSTRVMLFEIAADPTGTGAGTQVANRVRDYAQAVGKRLILQDVVNRGFVESLGWARPSGDHGEFGEHYLGANNPADISSRLMRTAGQWGPSGEPAEPMDKLYHTSKKEHRENILANGLKASGDPEVDPEPAVFMTPKHPQHSTDPHYWNPERDDVYEVNVQGLPIHHDPWGEELGHNYLADLGGSFYHPGDIPAERVKLISDQRTAAATPRYFHSTNAQLKPGDIIVPSQESGIAPNFPNAERHDPTKVYMWTEHPYGDNEMAIESWGKNIYEVEPLGPVEQDPEHGLYPEMDNITAHSWVTPSARVVRVEYQPERTAALPFSTNPSDHDLQNGSFKGTVDGGGNVHVWPVDNTGAPHHDSVTMGIENWQHGPYVNNEEETGPINDFMVENGYIWPSAGTGMPDAVKPLIVQSTGLRFPSRRMMQQNYGPRTADHSDSMGQPSTPTSPLPREANLKTYSPSQYTIEQWTPGRFGKGIFNPNTNELHSWVDHNDAPHHLAYSKMFNAQGLKFFIDPSGAVSHPIPRQNVKLTPYINQINSADPRLSVMGDSADDDEFRVGAYSRSLRTLQSDGTVWKNMGTLARNAQTWNGNGTPGMEQSGGTPARKGSLSDGTAGGTPLGSRLGSIAYNPEQEMHKGVIGSEGLHVWPVQFVDGDWNPAHIVKGLPGKPFVIRNGTVLGTGLNDDERLAIVRGTGARFKTAAWKWPQGENGPVPWTSLIPDNLINHVQLPGDKDPYAEKALEKKNQDGVVGIHTLMDALGAGDRMRAEYQIEAWAKEQAEAGVPWEEIYPKVYDTIYGAEQRQSWNDVVNEAKNQAWQTHARGGNWQNPLPQDWWKTEPDWSDPQVNRLFQNYRPNINPDEFHDNAHRRALDFAQELHRDTFAHSVGDYTNNDWEQRWYPTDGEGQANPYKEKDDQFWAFGSVEDEEWDDYPPCEHCGAGDMQQHDVLCPIRQQNQDEYEKRNPSPSMPMPSLAPGDPCPECSEPMRQYRNNLGHQWQECCGQQIDMTHPEGVPADWTDPLAEQYKVPSGLQWNDPRNSSASWDVVHPDLGCYTSSVPSCPSCGSPSTDNALGSRSYECMTCGNVWPMNRTPRTNPASLERQFNLPADLQWDDARNSSRTGTSQTRVDGSSAAASSPSSAAGGAVPFAKSPAAWHEARRARTRDRSRSRGDATAGSPRSSAHAQSPTKTARHSTAESVPPPARSTDPSTTSLPSKRRSSTVTPVVPEQSPGVAHHVERSAGHRAKEGGPANLARARQEHRREGQEPGHRSADEEGREHGRIVSTEVPSPVNQAALSVNPVGHDFEDFTDDSFGSPFIFDRGSQTIHLAPRGSRHDDIIKAVQPQLQGPIYNGWHDGFSVNWYNQPQAHERTQIAGALSTHTGYPLEDDSTGENEFKLGWWKVMKARIARAFGKTPLTCSTCGDPLPDGMTECMRCNWGGWNTSDDATKNPQDPTVDMHRGIQASLPEMPTLSSKTKGPSETKRAEGASVSISTSSSRALRRPPREARRDSPGSQTKASTTKPHPSALQGGASKSSAVGHRLDGLSPAAQDAFSPARPQSEPAAKSSSMDPPCPDCGSPMYWRDPAGLTQFHPEGAWECSNVRCWNMLIPGQLAPDTYDDPDTGSSGLTLPEHWGAWEDEPSWNRERLPWQPGVEGKGWLGENGVHTWQIDPKRYPRHMDERAYAENTLGIGPLRRTFQVEPNGYVWDVALRQPIAPEHLQAIQAHDPRLHGNSDDGEFKLGGLPPQSRLSEEPWEPGVEGKGILDGFGKLHTWQTDTGSPTHEMYKGGTPLYGSRAVFYIEPNGEIHAYGRDLTDDRQQQITALDPRLRPRANDENEFKIASQPYYYHVAPTSARQAIMEQGLMGHLNEHTESPWAEHREKWHKNIEQPPGNYLFSDPEDARDYPYSLSPPPEETSFEDFYDYGVMPSEGYGGAVVQPQQPADWDEENLGDWYDSPGAMEEQDWDHANPEHLDMLPPAKRGYDIWKVNPQGLTVLPDPEWALLHGGNRPDPATAIDESRQHAQDPHDAGDIDPSRMDWQNWQNDDTGPLRWYTPHQVQPQALELHEHVAPWEMTMENFYDRLDDLDHNAQPNPMQNIAPTALPLSPPQQSLVSKARSASEPFSRVFPS